MRLELAGLVCGLCLAAVSCSGGAPDDELEELLGCVDPPEDVGGLTYAIEVTQGWIAIDRAEFLDSLNTDNGEIAEAKTRSLSGFALRDGESIEYPGFVRADLLLKTDYSSFIFGLSKSVDPDKKYSASPFVGVGSDGAMEFLGDCESATTSEFRAFADHVAPDSSESHVVLFERLLRDKELQLLLRDLWFGEAQA